MTHGALAGPVVRVKSNTVGFTVLTMSERQLAMLLAAHTRRDWRTCRKAIREGVERIKGEAAREDLRQGMIALGIAPIPSHSHV